VLLPVPHLTSSGLVFGALCVQETSAVDMEAAVQNGPNCMFTTWFGGSMA
jgi:hypothetical protein